MRLLRVNYVGELGWELHCPMADMPKVFEALMAAGKPHGMRLFGTYAMNSLRMEKAYRGWGSELTSEIDMFEASMARFIRLDKPDFIGRDASPAMKQRGPRTNLVYLEVDAPDSDCVGNEPVYAGDRSSASPPAAPSVMLSANRSPSPMCQPARAEPGTEFEILMFGERRKARIVLPDGRRGIRQTEPAPSRLERHTTE